MRLSLLFLLVLLRCSCGYAEPLTGLYLALNGGGVVSDQYDVSFEINVGGVYMPMGPDFAAGSSMGYALFGALGNVLNKNFALEFELGYRYIEQDIIHDAYSSMANNILSIMFNPYYSIEFAKGFDVRGTIGWGFVFLASEGSFNYYDEQTRYRVGIVYKNALQTFVGIQPKIGFFYKMGMFGNIGMEYVALVTQSLGEVHDIFSGFFLHDGTNIISGGEANRNVIAVKGLDVLNHSVTVSLRLFFAS